jgi:23S rRNA (cytidine1920-2'-O)/16S rRNA (cytidine1409-2'-O)-methyltransferase
VTVRGLPVTRPASLVGPEEPIALTTDPAPFVSRGGLKLDAALERLDVVVSGRRWLDAGASTGGFTDRLLQGGAEAVVAVDVGYGQLDWGLRNNDRVTVMERANVRLLDATDLPWSADGVTADLSFISLTKVLPTLVGVATVDADFLLLVKPQFEVGREAVGKGGVVRDPRRWKAAIVQVVDAAAQLGLGLVDCVLAEPPGPSGNREFFVHLRRGALGSAEAIDREIEMAQ